MSYDKQNHTKGVISNEIYKLAHLKKDKTAPPILTCIPTGSMV